MHVQLFRSFYHLKRMKEKQFWAFQGDSYSVIRFVKYIFDMKNICIKTSDLPLAFWNVFALSDVSNVI